MENDITCGHFCSVGRFFSWKRLSREVFCSFAIILFKASFSFPSLSSLWKKRVYLKKYFSQKIVGRSQCFECPLHLLTMTAVLIDQFVTMHCWQGSWCCVNSGALGKYIRSLFHTSAETSRLSFSSILSPPAGERNSTITEYHRKNQPY